MIVKGKKVKASVQSCWTMHAADGTSTEVSLEILVIASFSSTHFSYCATLPPPIYIINLDCLELDSRQ